MTTTPTFNYQDAVVKIITAFHPDAKLYLFGSYARGKQRQGSDVDLAIDAGEELSFKEISLLRNLLSALPSAQMIELVDMHNIPEYFRTEILSHGILWKT
jgi:uncharacterized protein